MGYASSYGKINGPFSYTSVTLATMQLTTQTLIKSSTSQSPWLDHEPAVDFTEFEINEAVNEILDDIMGQCSSGDASDFDDDYTHIVTPGTHC
jgi:hypothetical protein